MVVAVAWFLNSTRAGLILRAVGENDNSAHSIGYSVIGVRYGAVAFGGAMVLIMAFRPRGLISHREPSIRLHPR